MGRILNVSGCNFCIIFVFCLWGGGPVDSVELYLSRIYQFEITGYIWAFENAYRTWNYAGVLIFKWYRRVFLGITGGETFSKRSIDLSRNVSVNKIFSTDVVAYHKITTLGSSLAKNNFFRECSNSGVIFAGNSI